VAALGRAHHLHARRLGVDTVVVAAVATVAGGVGVADERAKLIRTVQRLCSTGRKLRAKDIPKVRGERTILLFTLFGGPRVGWLGIN
jgi:hypothetical protein